MVETIKPCGKCQPSVSDTVIGSNSQTAAAIPQDRKPALIPTAHMGQFTEMQALHPQKTGEGTTRATDAALISTLVPAASNTTKPEPVVYTGQAPVFGPDVVLGLLVSLTILNWV